MAIKHAQAGDVIDVFPSDEPHASRTVALLKSDRVELIRLIVPAGKEIPEHRAPGELILHCLAGVISVTGAGKTNQLQAGQAVFLAAHEPHSVRGVVDGILLLTLFLPSSDESNAVDEASEESFPASDAPAWTGGTPR